MIESLPLYTQVQDSEFQAELVRICGNNITVTEFLGALERNNIKDFGKWEIIKVDKSDADEIKKQAHVCISYVGEVQSIAKRAMNGKKIDVINKELTNMGNRLTRAKMSISLLQRQLARFLS